MLPGDLVIACTTIQNDKAIDTVATLCYTARGLFQTIRGTGYDGCIVRKLNKSDSPEFKFMSEGLYILPPSLKPCEPMDGSDPRYLNQSHDHIVNPL